VALLRSTSDLWIPLPAHCVVGRSRMCALRIADAVLSAEHARLWWSERAWWVRDLGSRNGTFVADQRLPPGHDRRLQPGDRVVFGAEPHAYVLADASGPEPTARNLSTGALVAGRDGLLALPEPHAPTANVFEGRNERWCVEDDDGERAVADGAILEVGSDRWMLHLPLSEPGTVEAQRLAPEIEDVDLRFEVSADEETVEIELRHGTLTWRLEARSHYYALLTLARARLDDAQRTPDRKEGWRAVDDLCHQLRCDPNKLNVDIFRCRQDVAALGLRGAARLVERKRSTRELRVLSDRITIARLG
jgi:hypothetical protein